MPRPLKLDPAVMERLLQAVARGNTREDSARLAGVGVATLYRWLRLGRSQKRGKFREFREAIKKAEAEAVDKRVTAIAAAGMEPKTWQASAWWLERRRPDDWWIDKKRLAELEKRLAELEKAHAAAGLPQRT
jgi:hypothetical protein